VDKWAVLAYLTFLSPEYGVAADVCFLVTLFDFDVDLGKVALKSRFHFEEAGFVREEVWIMVAAGSCVVGMGIGRIGDGSVAIWVLLLSLLVAAFWVEGTFGRWLLSLDVKEVLVYWVNGVDNFPSDVGEAGIPSGEVIGDVGFKCNQIVSGEVAVFSHVLLVVVVFGMGDEAVEIVLEGHEEVSPDMFAVGFLVGDPVTGAR
jgi:hypothetical protein